ncbi:MAG: hypothetical protein J1E62_11045, partial [Lachnospiraceae bacterium]|nr:hypothetical protein [Lachnospiraceae bacterium]
MQTLALPLGYSAVFRFCEYATFVHKNEKLCPHDCKGWYSLFGINLNYAKQTAGADYEARTRYLHLGKVAL